MIPYSSHFYNHIDMRYRGTVSLLVLLYNWKWLISSYDLTILISILWFLILLFGAKRVKLFSRPSVIIAISLFCTKHHIVTNTSPATQHLLLSNWKSFLFHGTARGTAHQRDGFNDYLIDPLWSFKIHLYRTGVCH